MCEWKGAGLRFSDADACLLCLLAALIYLYAPSLAADRARQSIEEVAAHIQSPARLLEGFLTRRQRQRQ